MLPQYLAIFAFFLAKIQAKQLYQEILTQDLRKLDTVDTINALLEDVQIAIEDPIALECEDFFIGGLNFNTPFVTEVNGLQRQVVEIEVTGFKTSCQMGFLSFASEDSSINFRLEFFSEGIGRVIPTTGGVPDDFDCREEFITLVLSGPGSNVAENQLPGVICDELEPLFSEIALLISDNILIDVGGVRPPVSPSVSIEEVLETEERLSVLLPSGFEFHNEAEFELMLDTWNNKILNTPIIRALKVELESIKAAFEADSAEDLAFALENLVFVLVGLRVPVPTSIAQSILDIDFSEGLIETLLELLGNLDLNDLLSSLIRLILDLLGIDLPFPLPNEFTSFLEQHPITDSLITAVGVKETILEVLEIFTVATEGNTLNIAADITIKQALENAKSTTFTSYLKNFPENENLDIGLNQYIDLPVEDLCHIFTSFSTNEVEEVFGIMKTKSIREIAEAFQPIVAPTTNEELYNSIVYFARTLDINQISEMLTDVYVNEDDIFVFNITLDGFGLLELSLIDINATIEIDSDTEISGTLGESSIVLPKFTLNTLEFTFVVGIDVFEGDELFLSDILSFSAGLNGFTQEALTLAFNYGPLLNYGFNNMEDLVSSLRVLGDLFGCALANFAVSLSAQSTSFDLSANLDSADALAGFAENFINTLVTLYVPVVPTAVEALLAELSETDFLVVDALKVGCTRQGFSEKGTTGERIEQLFRDLNEGVLIAFSVIGMIFMSTFAAAVIFSKKKPEGVESMISIKQSEAVIAPPTV